MEIKIRVWVDGQEIDLAPMTRAVLESSVKRQVKKKAAAPGVTP